MTSSYLTLVFQGEGDVFGCLPVDPMFVCITLVTHMSFCPP